MSASQCEGLRNLVAAMQLKRTPQAANYENGMPRGFRRRVRIFDAKNSSQRNKLTFGTWLHRHLTALAVHCWTSCCLMAVYMQLDDSKELGILGKLGRNLE